MPSIIHHSVTFLVWQVVEQLGRGAFATVLRVRHQGVLMALKVLRTGLEEQKTATAMFFKEALAQKRCSIAGQR